MSKSYAEVASGWQGFGNYPGHDIYQNGIINGNCDRIYMAMLGYLATLKYMAMLNYLARLKYMAMLKCVVTLGYLVLMRYMAMLKCEYKEVINNAKI